MAPVTDEAALRLASRERSARSISLRGIVEPAGTVHSVAKAVQAFCSDPRLHHVVLLDSVTRRPVCVVTAEAAALGVVTEGVRANLDTPVDQILTRCMTRNEGERFDPILVTDNAGRFAGIARMERLITALAVAYESGHPEAAPTN
ncbi:hypothetical protein [Arthrobacter sp. 260]|uniref:hypothetical protein n=1 Tax=Arthrobacter sp. 260 TaxID=2735314 RepID=UPI001E4545E8|nr:hypothetical protein [Arthrobacter sp. 260]